MLQKTKVLTLILFGLLFLNLSAQEDNFSNDPEAKLPDSERKYRFGLQFSPNIAWFKSNTTGYKNERMNIGFSYGLSFEYFMTQNYMISTGIIMLNSGGELSYKGTIYSYQADIISSYDLSYVEIPLVLKLRTNEIGYLTYFGQFGLKTGLFYGSKVEHSYTYNDLQSPIPLSYSKKINNVSGDINFINVYLVLGGGIEYNISGNTILMLGLTFNNGFVNQLDKKIPVFDTNGNVVLDQYENTLYSDKKASANLNYVALNFGIYF
ncbi:MAG: hypothetical protein COX70_09910 [Flavobacteriales bacterium CG_4_10_14_0_2_um_filter_32_8]|nr:MAG: hypothetical protein COX70_09910 [Flavobacteriales bacterium CG_4_10_14_0_2_um_filter_32_8]PJB14898.1 MAG: hypothetical protein CO118_06195 [Flavobacteriales bacterium CG_4_9_14_3_um_filter_32_8]